MIVRISTLRVRCLSVSLGVDAGSDGGHRRSWYQGRWRVETGKESSCALSEESIQLFDLAWQSDKGAVRLSGRGLIPILLLNPYR